MLVVVVVLMVSSTLVYLDWWGSHRFVNYGLAGFDAASKK